MSYYQNSQCHRAWLHDFAPLMDNSEIYVEVCKRCHLKNFYRKDPRGKINNRRYVAYHIKEVLQPFNKLFNHEHANYGNKSKRS